MDTLNDKINDLFQAFAELRDAIPADLKADVQLPPRVEAKPAGRLLPVDDDIVCVEDEVEDFELRVLADEVEQFATELSATLALAEGRLLADAIRVYWTAEELSRDPRHADLIPWVQQMREAFERDIGRPIPKRRER